MRTACWARGAGCALALAIAIVVPASAEPSRRSLAACMRFEQTSRGEDAVAFTLHNGCTIPVDCSVSWRVVCAPDARKRRAAHAGSVKLAIGDGASQTAEASAALCGADAWSIDSVEWRCTPNND